MTNHRRSAPLCCGLLLALAVIACEQKPTPATTKVTDVHMPGDAIDSALPMPELLHRFQSKVPDTPAVLANAAPSRDSLLARFLSGVERNDTLGVARLSLTPGEFAFLYFPGSRLSRPPYELDPALAWFQVSGNTTNDLRKLMRALGGKPVRTAGYGCDSTLTEGKNTLYTHCAVRVITPRRDTMPMALFGTIMERDGRFKFVGLANRI